MFLLQEQTCIDFSHVTNICNLFQDLKKDYMRFGQEGNTITGMR